MTRPQAICIIKKGRHLPILGRHPWVFSGAIEKFPSCEPGEVVAVVSADGHFLGQATCNQQSQIALRMLTYDEKSVEEIVQEKVEKAIALRRCVIAPHTNAYRLINAEGDGCPGLVVDIYADVAVMQISTIGMERLKPLFVAALVQHLPLNWVYEKSLSPSRLSEGLALKEGTLFGLEKERIAICEEGLHFYCQPQHGQKTGFFLDQREMRLLVHRMARGLRVLNCFSYSGAFSVHALAGGALQCDSIDISEEAIHAAQEHVALNHLDPAKHRAIAADVFAFLRQQPLEYDLVILDPPAFAKKQSDMERAVRGYKDINRQAIKRMPKGAFLLTCSCSYHIDTALFRRIVQESVLEAGRSACLIQQQRLALDHPQNFFHPEGSYLKSLLLRLD